jgi:type I restriction enzyme S subunit
MLERRVVMPDGSTKGYKLVEPGNFIISLRSFQGGLEYSRHRGLVSPAYTVLEPIKKIDDEFYKQYYKSYNFVGHLAVAVIGIRDGKQVSYDDFSFLKLPYPKLKEQQAIAQILTTADQEIEALKQRLEHLKQEKKALMQQLLTGKKRVKVDAEEADYSIAN